MAPPLRTNPLRRSPLYSSKSQAIPLQTNSTHTMIGSSTESSELHTDRPRKQRRFAAIDCAFLGIILFIFAVYIGIVLPVFYSNDKSTGSSLLSYRMIEPYGVIKSLFDYRGNPSQSSFRGDKTGGNLNKMMSSSTTSASKPSDLKSNFNNEKKGKKDYPVIEISTSHANAPKSTTSAQKIFLLPSIATVNATGEHGHILLDGITRSNILEETLDPDDPDAVWVVNLIKYSCISKTVPAVQARWDRMVLQGRELRPWKIYLLDFADERYLWARNCIELINTIFSNSTTTMAENYVHFGTRQLMWKRHIVHKWGDSEELPFTDFGKKIKLRQVDEIVNGTTRVVRFAVRTDLVDHIEKLMLEKQEKEPSDLDIVTVPKPKDVVHFWKPWSAQTKSAHHRKVISNKLLDYAKQPENANLTIVADQVGHGRGVGRRQLCVEYAEALLEFKIIVVCQRDWYEGHYRLMEALVSGAMVMTDPMHPLPYHIEDKKQVIVYSSIAELRNYITYYLSHKEERLAIARSGYEIAMREHRSWHWMERLIFGDWSNEHGGS